ncbi:hypothetical protein ABVK25_000984 [Lepraria finkii]|uniref:DRBM domain-containing protein n=1 Tax=Lepraria finkii TaxID=1340010 RepID=A0ABR4BQZ8_9LECA
MDAKRKEPGTPVEAGRNWVGMLHEYHNLSGPNRGPVFNDYAVGLVYACECIIPSRPDQPFGSKTETFPSKKAARSNCAREAVEHLISEEQLNPDGSTKARKRAKPGTAGHIQDSGLEVKKGTSYTQKVQDICPLLGLTSPQYILAPASNLVPNILSGYASFPNQPGMPKEIGEVRNIFGKKNAKEEVAKGVWEVLQALAQKRNVRMEAEGTGSD